MRLYNIVKSLLIAIVIFCSVDYVYPQESTGALNVLWQKDFGCSENLSYCLGAIAFNRVNNTLLVMGTSFNPKNYSNAKFWLWKVDENGNRIKNTIVKEVPESDGEAMKQAYTLIRSLAISSNGDIFVVGELDGITESFMKISQEGEIIFNKSVYDKELGDVDILINKMLPLSNNNFLLIGKDGENGLIMKIDSEGNRLWRKRHDIGQIELFTDGVSMDDGSGFLLVGNVANYAESGMIGPSDIWVLRCDAEGNIISEELFPGNPMPGKWPQVCRLDSGNFVVAYDSKPKMMSMSTDHRIRAFSPNLKVLWDKEVTKLEKGPPIFFKIIDIPRGFIVANCINFTDLKLYEYNEKGHNLSSVSVNKGAFSSRFSLVYAKEKAFVVSEAFCKNNDTLSEVKVNAIQLTKK